GISLKPLSDRRTLRSRKLISRPLPGPSGKDQSGGAMMHIGPRRAATVLVASLTLSVFFVLRDIPAARSAPEPDPFPPGQEPPLRFVTWQGSERLVATSETHVAVWDVATGKQRGLHKLGSAAAHPLAQSPVSPDGKRLVLEAAKEGIGRLVSLED